MDRAFLLIPLLLAGGVGRSAVVPAVPAAAVAPASTTADVEALQLRLLAAQQVIATLERQVAEEHNRSAALEQARLRNGHLVSIARQLVDAYDKRYGMRRSHDPLQLGRRRFEFELQALSEAIYDMNADVPLRAVPGGATVAPPTGPVAARLDGRPTLPVASPTTDDPRQVDPTATMHQP